MLVPCRRGALLGGLRWDRAIHPERQFLSARAAGFPTIQRLVDLVGLAAARQE